MTAKPDELKNIATKLLAGMLSNPHIYTSAADEQVRGQQEQTLILAAVEMAEVLIDRVENHTNPAL